MCVNIKIWWRHSPIAAHRCKEKVCISCWLTPGDAKSNSRLFAANIWNLFVACWRVLQCSTYASVLKVEQQQPGRINTITKKESPPTSLKHYHQPPWSPKPCACNAPAAVVSASLAALPARVVLATQRRPQWHLPPVRQTSQFLAGNLRKLCQNLGDESTWKSSMFALCTHHNHVLPNTAATKKLRR